MFARRRRRNVHHRTPATAADVALVAEVEAELHKSCEDPDKEPGLTDVEGDNLENPTFRDPELVPIDRPGLLDLCPVVRHVREIGSEPLLVTRVHIRVWQQRRPKMSEPRASSARPGRSKRGRHC